MKAGSLQKLRPQLIIMIYLNGRGQKPLWPFQMEPMSCPDAIKLTDGVPVKVKDKKCNQSERFWRSFGGYSVLLCHKTEPVVLSESGTLRILGGNQTVNQVQQVRFQCVAAGWYPTPSISWSENGQAVDSSLFNTSSSISGGVYNSTSILSFSASSSTTIKCLASISALQEPLSDAVFLTVGENVFMTGKTPQFIRSPPHQDSCLFVCFFCFFGFHVFKKLWNIKVEKDIFLLFNCKNDAVFFSV